MDAGATQDLFATKGIEYLIVIAYLIVLVGFWRLLKKPVPGEQMLTTLVESRPVQAAVRLVGGWFDLPEDRRYHQGHAWVRAQGGEVHRVGLDDFAQQLLGPPDTIELPSAGTELRQGQRGWTVVIDGERFDMLSPLDGEVVAVNSATAESPEVVCTDPYGQGWLLDVRVRPPAASLNNLLDGRVARTWMETVVERVRAASAGNLGSALPDGGLPVAGFGRALATDDWPRAVRQLLLTEEPDR